MCLDCYVDKPAVRRTCISRHQHFDARLGTTLHPNVDLARPERNVLMALQTRAAKVVEHRGVLVQRLYQLDLHRSTVAERDAQLGRRRRAAIAEVLDRGLLEVEEGANTEDVCPMCHRGVNVADDISD